MQLKYFSQSLLWCFYDLFFYLMMLQFEYMEDVGVGAELSCMKEDGHKLREDSHTFAIRWYLDVVLRFVVQLLFFLLDYIIFHKILKLGAFLFYPLLCALIKTNNVTYH